MRKYRSLKYQEVSNKTEQFTRLHCRLPLIKSRSELLAHIERLSSQEYHKHRFSQPEPTMEAVEEALRREAESGDMPEIMLSSTAQDYADEYCEREYSSKHSQWETAQKSFESTENMDRTDLDERRAAELEELRRSLDADQEYIARQADIAVKEIPLPYTLPASAEVHGGSVLIEAEMPGIDVIPSEQVTACGRSVRSKTPKERKLDYVQHVFSTAVYLAGRMFSISPNVSRVEVSMYKGCRDKHGEQALMCILSAVFSREDFEGVDWLSPDFSPQKFCEQAESRFIVTPSGLMRKVRPFTDDMEEH